MGDWTEEIKARRKDLSAGASRRDPSYGVPRADGHIAPDKLAEGSGVPAQRICSLLVRGEETTIAPDLSCKAWPILRYGRGSLGKSPGLLRPADRGGPVGARSPVRPSSGWQNDWTPCQAQAGSPFHTF